MKRLLVVFIIAMSLHNFGSAQSQWYYIPGYLPCSIQINCRGGWCPLPISNGKIFYGAICSNGPQGAFSIMESTNDLDTAYCIPLDEDFGCCGNYNAVAKDSSAQAFIYQHQYWFEVFSVRNFGISQVGTFSPGTGGVAGALAASGNYVYCTSKCNYYFGDSLLIYQYGISGYLIRTTEIMDSLPSQMFFVNDSTGFMLCNGAKSWLYKTINYGVTWSISCVDSLNVITGFCFPSQNVGYLTKSNGGIMKTTDGGASWTPIASPTSNQLNCVSFANDSLGYIGGNAGFLDKTVDGGATWTTEVSNDNIGISSIYTFGTVAYFIDSLDGLFKNEPPIRDSSKTKKPTNSNSTNSFSIYPNPAPHGTFTVVLPTDSANYEMNIYNILGQKVYSLSLSQQSGIGMQVNLANKAGLYFYRVLNESGNLVSKGKLLLEH